MKCALLADIHANSHALRAVLTAAEEHRVDALLIAGDLVGYYFSPREVLAMLEPWSKYIVRGNHENILKKCRENPEALVEIESKYGSGIRIALETLSDNQLDWIENLPATASLNIEGCKIFLCHGTPFSEEGYLYPDSPSDTLSKYSTLPYDFIIMGHTHYPMDRKAGGVRLVNPGSVGQPRTKKKKGSAATLDTSTGKVEIFSVAYDAASLVKECKNRHPDIPYLADVLLEK